MKKHRCIYCGLMFVPDRYNKHHQTCCGRSECRLARDRVRRQRYRKSKADDPEFRRHEVSRVQDYRRRKKNSTKHDPGKSRQPAVDSGLLYQLAITGLAAQLGGCRSTEEISDFLYHCIEHGRRLYPDLVATGVDPSHFWTNSVGNHQKNPF